MWFAIAFVAALFITLALMPNKRQIEDARVANLGDFNFPRSQYGDVIPIIFGTVEQKAPVVTWFGGFAAFPIEQEVSTGLFSSDNVITGYNYTIAMDLAICLGPDCLLRQIKCENRLIWGGGVASAGEEIITINMPELFGGQSSGGGIGGLGADDCEFWEGKLSQTASPYMASLGVSPLPKYNGICHIVLAGLYVGTSPNIKPFSFVVSRVTDYLSASYSKMGDDVNPMEIVYIVMTQTWGHLGIDPGLIDVGNFQAAAQVLHGEGIKMSMMVSSESTGKAVLDECMRVADAVLYQDPTTGKIKVSLIRSDYVIGSLLVLDESNIIGDLDNLGKTTWESTFNQVRVTFKNRAMEYNESVALLQDFSNINYQDRIKSTTISMPGVKEPSVASEMARRQLSMISVPLFKCEIKANRTARVLRPGDCFVLNWPPYGMSDMVMRVTSVDLGELLNNEVKISCVQDRFAIDVPTFEDPGESGHEDIIYDAQEITDFLIWEPPSYFVGNVNSVTTADLTVYNTQSRFQVQAVAPAGGASVAFLAYLGQTSSPTAQAMGQQPYYGKGTLVNAFASTVAADDGVDSTNTFEVSGLDAKTMQALVNNATLEAARYGTSMFMIGNELFAYVGLTDMTGGVVKFNTVYRCLLDTARESHSAGATVWFIHRGSGLIPQLLSYGDDVYIKLIDRTPKGPFLLADATAEHEVLSGRAKKPLPPQYVTIDGSRTPPTKVSETSITVAWRRRTRLNPKFRAYNDTSDTTGETIGNLSHRVRWKLDSDPEDSFMVDDSGSFATSYAIDVTGMVGTLVVRVDTYDNVTSEYSTIADSISVVLT